MKYYLYISKTNDVYANQAVEKLLLEECPQDGMVVYLWANHHTIVIGRNQNAFAELRVKLFAGEEGSLARRISGGGAVYHDINNLNFTFIAPNNGIYNKESQFNIIVRAVNSLGIEARLSGRNDIETAGRKFSGNAFFNTETHSLHHGTILINTDISKLERYLTVDKSKIISKGVSSVSSRVVNLSRLNPKIDREAVISSIISALGEDGVVNIQMEKFSERIKVLAEEFKNPDWIMGKNAQYAMSKGARFDWGTVEVRYEVARNTVTAFSIFTDALEYELFAALPDKFTGVKIDNLNALAAGFDENDKNVIRDIVSLLTDSV